jgi:MSHA biogenesis protein MshO
MNKLNLKKIILKIEGFSLIEMMVVVVILGLIVLGLVTFFTGGAKSWVAGQSQLEAQRNARQAMDIMVREIREGKNIVSGSDGDTIIINFPSAFVKNDVTYSWSGNPSNIVYRDAVPLINNVKKLFFTYTYPSVPTDILDVSKVHIELEVDVDNDDKPDITLNTDVNLRNYGL